MSASRQKWARVSIALVALQGVLGYDQAAAQQWTPFASASAFSTVEATNAVEQVPLEQGMLVRPTVEVQTGHNAGAVVGVFMRTARTQNVAVYSVGIAMYDDVAVAPENVTQGVQIRNQTMLGRRWSLAASEGVFWGLFRAEQDLAFLGLDQAADLDGWANEGPLSSNGDDQRGARPAAPPEGAEPVSAPVPVAPASGIDGSDRTDQAAAGPDAQIFAVHTLRYVRSATTLSISHRPAARWNHSLNFGLDVQYFVDRDLIRKYAIELVDNYSVRGGYTATYNPVVNQAFSLGAESTTSWFSTPIAPPQSTSDDGQTEYAQSVGLRLGWRYVPRPRWFLGAGAGGQVSYVLDRPDERAVTATATGGGGYQRGQWTYSATAFQTVQQSELGAIFLSKGGRMQADGWLLPALSVTLGVQAARQDVAVLVLAPGEDPREVDRDALGGYSVAATARLSYALEDYGSISLSYMASHAQRDGGENRRQVSHRLLAGIILGTGGS